MKQIIKQLSIKILQIFLPIFLIIIAFVVSISPLIYAINFKVVHLGYYFLGLIITIPLAIAIIIIVNNITDWYTIWDFDYLRELIGEYRHRPKDQSSGGTDKYKYKECNKIDENDGSSAVGIFD
jgi:hypothetical protein